MHKLAEYNDGQLIRLIRNGDEPAFDRVFILYFKNLHAYAATIIKDNEAAEEVIQNVFCRIWEKRHQLNPDGYLKSFLYRAVHNECLNYLKHQRVRSTFQVYYTEQAEQREGNLSKEIQASELEQHIHRAVHELPDKCRAIFQLSRFEQLRYQQIADQLNISVKTVENQMGKALKLLRLKLADFLILLIVYFIQSL